MHRRRHTLAPGKARRELPFDLNAGRRSILQGEIVVRRSVAVALVTAACVFSAQSALAQLGEKKVLTLAVAQKMVAAAQAEAERQKLAGVIAVVDDGGWPILVLRMDNAAYVASIELAPGKARTAALFKKPSQVLEDAINHGDSRLLRPVISSRCRAASRSLQMARSLEASARASIHRSTTCKSHRPGSQGLIAEGSSTISHRQRFWRISPQASCSFYVLSMRCTTALKYGCQQRGEAFLVRVPNGRRNESRIAIDLLVGPAGLETAT